MVKWLIGIAIALVVIFTGLGVGGYFFANSQQGKDLIAKFKPGAKAREVRFALIERGDLVRTVSAPGIIEPETNVKISAQVSARIEALPFRPGDEVRKGDVVCRLDAVDLKARLDASKARLQATRAQMGGAEANLSSTLSEFGRARELFDAGDTPKSDLERAEATYFQAKSAFERLQAEIIGAEAEVVSAQKDLENAIITSPIDGIMTTLNSEVGELVVVGTLNTPGSVIMEIANLSKMLLKAQVDEANIKPVKPGQRARIYTTFDAEGELWGRVQRINLKREVNPADGTGYFEVEILVEVPEGERLLSGLTANTEIEVETFADVLKVPSQSVLDRRIDELPRTITDGNPNIDATKTFARVLFVEREGKAIAQPVQVGPSDLTHTVILAGAEAGTRVVAGPYRELTTLTHDAPIVDEVEANKKREEERLAKERAKNPGAASTSTATSADTSSDAGSS